MRTCTFYLHKQPFRCWACLIRQAVYYLKIQIHSIILAVECYIISFNGIDPFIFIFPFINFVSFSLVGGGGRGVHFWPSHKLGGKFWILAGGVTFLISLSWLKNHRSPSSHLSHKNVQSIEIRYDNATLFHNNKNPCTNFLFYNWYLVSFLKYV